MTNRCSHFAIQHGGGNNDDDDDDDDNGHAVASWWFIGAYRLGSKGTAQGKQRNGCQQYRSYVLHVVVVFLLVLLAVAVVGFVVAVVLCLVVFCTVLRFVVVAGCDESLQPRRQEHRKTASCSRTSTADAQIVELCLLRLLNRSFCLFVRSSCQHAQTHNVEVSLLVPVPCRCVGCLCRRQPGFFFFCFFFRFFFALLCILTSMLSRDENPLLQSQAAHLCRIQ